MAHHVLVSPLKITRRCLLFLADQRIQINRFVPDGLAVPYEMAEAHCAHCGLIGEDKIDAGFVAPAGIQLINPLPRPAIELDRQRLGAFG